MAVTDKSQPKPLQPLERPPSLYHSVQEAIRTYILDNSLQAGDALPPETEFARQLGVSRNLVREAVKALESLGVLEIRRGSGLFVRDFSFEPLLDNLYYGLLFDLRELAELLQVRRVLETGMMADVIQSLSAEQLAGLQGTVERMRLRAEKGEAFVEEDREFHQWLFQNLGNKTLLKLLDIFWLTFRKAAEHVDLWDYQPTQTYRDHAAILEAVMARDVAQARTALDQHYQGLTEKLKRIQQA